MHHHKTKKKKGKLLPLFRSCSLHISSPTMDIKNEENERINHILFYLKNSHKASLNCWFKESCDSHHSRTRFLFKLAIYEECDLPSSIFFYVFNRYKDQIEWKKKNQDLEEEEEEEEEKKQHWLLVTNHNYN